MEESGEFDKFLKESTYSEEIEEIDANSLEGLRQVNNLAARIFAEDPRYEASRNVLGPEHVQTVIRAATTHDFPSPGEVSPEEYQELLKSANKRAELERIMTVRLIEKGATFGLSEFERDVLITSYKIGGTYDEVFRKWWTDVFTNPENDNAEELGLTNPYTVISNGEEVSFAERYTKEIREICWAWRGLADRIEKFKDDPEAKALQVYFDAYSDALGSSKGDGESGQDFHKRVVGLWRKVDLAWSEIHGRLVPLGSRETIWNATRKIIDFRVIFSLSSELSREGEAAKGAMIEYLEERFGETEIWRESERGMKKVDLRSDTFNAGLSGALNMEPSAQVWPEGGIAKEEGAKVFINEEASSRRWKGTKKFASEIFAEDKELFDLVDEADRVISLVCHEFGEMLENKKAEEILGQRVVNGIGEELSDLENTASMPHGVQSGKLEERRLLSHAIFILGISLRAVKLTTKGSYYNRAIWTLGRMLDSGFIEKEGENWRIRPNSVEKFFQNSGGDLGLIVSILEKKDKPVANNYLEKVNVIKESSDIKYLSDRVAATELES